MKLREAVAEAEQTLAKLKEMQTRMGPDAVIGLKPGSISGGGSSQESAELREAEDARFASNLGFGPEKVIGRKILKHGRAAFDPMHNSAFHREPKGAA